MSADERAEARFQELKRRVEIERGKPPMQRLLEQVDAVLASPLTIEPLSKLAEERTQRAAQRVRDPKTKLPDDGKADYRAAEWNRWYDKVRESVLTDGVKLLTRLTTLAPNERERIDALSGRVTSLLHALRDLQLEWWPTHWIEKKPYRELSLLDWCERELGALDTQDIRRRRGIQHQPPQGSDSLLEFFPPEAIR